MAEALQNSSLAQWISGSGSLLGYPTILFLHTIGLATLAGLNAMIDLRVIGVAPSIPLRPLSKLFVVMWSALAVATVSGIALFVADASTRSAQPMFWAKLLFVGLASTSLYLLRIRVFTQEPDEPVADGTAKVLAATSLVCLLAATTAGRLLAYVS